MSERTGDTIIVLWRPAGLRPGAFYGSNNEVPTPDGHAWSRRPPRPLAGWALSSYNHALAVIQLKLVLLQRATIRLLPAQVEAHRPVSQPGGLLFGAREDYMGATLFTLSGMIIVAIGAFITAQSVIITELQANELSGAYYDKNQSLRAALLK